MFDSRCLASTILNRRWSTFVCNTGEAGLPRSIKKKQTSLLSVSARGPTTRGSDISLILCTYIHTCTQWVGSWNRSVPFVISTKVTRKLYYPRSHKNSKIQWKRKIEPTRSTYCRKYLHSSPTNCSIREYKSPLIVVMRARNWAKQH